MIDALKDFLKLESAGGIALIAAAALAMAIANSPLSGYYDALLAVPVTVTISDFGVDKPLLLWINDGLMALFFLLVGLEIKREILDGELKDPKTVALPAFGALGGIVVPAAIYWYLNQNDPLALEGWAIPAATDIAFALAVLATLGSRVPTALKVFLVTVAIFDDLSAILIIAVFYTSKVSLTALAVAAACLPILFLLNRRRVTEFSPYLIIGLVMWLAVLKSGIHATLAGVVLAQFIPLKDPKKPDYSPLKSLEHDLHTAVAFLVLPIFAFANAGLDLRGSSLDALLHPVPLGIAAALVFGKQIGVFGMAGLALLLRVARLPEGVGFAGLFGAAILCGVGFTMSLFIGSLAFPDTAVKGFDERVGILAGSLASAVLGYLFLRLALKPDATAEENAEITDRAPA
ncbi:MAG: Na+/H+ antiporter NhaA [Pseudomonadota bacterium]